MIHFFLLAVFQSVEHPYLPDVFLDRARFVVRSTASIRRISDDSTIMVSCFEPSASKLFLTPRSAVIPLRTLPSDGFPLGAIAEIYRKTSHIDVRVADVREIVEITINSPKDRQPRGLVSRPLDYASDEVWLVAAAREAMAKFAARRVGPMGIIAVRGRSVASFVAKETDVRFVDFEQYLSALGTAPHRNDTDKRYAFTVSGTNYLVLLGTSKMKVGPEWMTMQDHPMLVNGRIFVPKQFLPD